MKKWLIILSLVLVISGSFVVLYDFPKSITIEYPAVEFRAGDPSSVANTTIKIKGTLYRPLFGDSKFRGRIIVDKYDFTKTNSLINITFWKDVRDRNGLGTIVYATEKPSLISLGYIQKRGNFDNLKILVIEPIGAGSGTITNLEVVAPAKDYDTALAIDHLYTE